MDVIQHQGMLEAQRLHPKWGKTRALGKSRRARNVNYFKAVNEAIADACRDLRSNETRVIFLDRHYPAADFLAAELGRIDSKMAWGIPYCKVYLIPKIEGEMIADYPFSY